MLKVERQINRARTLRTPESASLQKELAADHERLDYLRQQADEHLVKAKTRLQVIEATARRRLTEGETDLMMQRLGNAQDQLPLVLEMAQLEQEALSRQAILQPREFNEELGRAKAAGTAIPSR